MGTQVKRGNRTTGEYITTRERNEKGNIETKHAYISPRKPIHYVVKYDGFGISSDILEDMYFNKNIDEIIFVYKRKQDKKPEVYKTTPSKMVLEGTEDKLGGFEKQHFLSLDQMKKIPEWHGQKCKFNQNNVCKQK